MEPEENDQSGLLWRQNGDSDPEEGRSSSGEGDKGKNETRETIRPFRLVKYFSFTGFIVILVVVLGLTIFMSQQTKNMVLKKRNDYARLLAENLNHQVFLQFVIPTAIRYGRIRLRDPEQFQLLDSVVRQTIHSFNVLQVNIYDLEGIINYSTQKDLVGTRTKAANQASYEAALAGKPSLIVESLNTDGLTGLGRVWTMRTFFPFRAEERFKGPVGEVLGVFEIFQDLTEDYSEITKFQYLSIAVSLTLTAILFVILRKILARGEGILEQRNEERRRLEQKLHHSERLAVLGQMVAAVSHEIRNPLGIISSTAEILHGRIKAYEPKNRLAEVIVEESRRLNGIVTEFLDFARPQKPRPQPCRLVDVLDKNLAFLGPTLEKEQIEVVRDYQGDGEIQADPDLLYRAFLNLFVNAVQAMPEGGVLTVSFSMPYGPDGHGLGAEVVISDTGEGIDPEAAETLFNPFVTTKNRGSGLGLAIVKNIIESHKGEVGISSAPKAGAKVTVRLPINQK